MAGDLKSSSVAVPSEVYRFVVSGFSGPWFAHIVASTMAVLQDRLELVERLHGLGLGRGGGFVLFPQREQLADFNRKEPGEVVLLLIYAKANLDSISGETLKELRDAAEKANE